MELLRLVTMNMDLLISNAEVPIDLSGLSVLDVGTTNGAASFECEKRGAREIVAVDICPPDGFGFINLQNT
jgi:predicted RNA methylase